MFLLAIIIDKRNVISKVFNFKAYDVYIYIHIYTSWSNI